MGFHKLWFYYLLIPVSNEHCSEVEPRTTVLCNTSTLDASIEILDSLPTALIVIYSHSFLARYIKPCCSPPTDSRALTSLLLADLPDSFDPTVC